MPEVISIYHNDLEPTFYIDIVNYDPDTDTESVADLSALGTVVQFETSPIDGGPLRINSPLTPVNASQGKFKYDWAPNDTAVVDKFNAVIKIITPTARPRTARKFELHVLEN
jgi:hypothetical protein